MMRRGHGMPPPEPGAEVLEEWAAELTAAAQLDDSGDGTT